MKKPRAPAKTFKTNPALTTGGRYMGQRSFYGEAGHGANH